MLPEFLSATSAIKSSLEIIKAIQKIKDTSQIQQKTIELNSIILDLQNSLFSLRDAYADITNRHAELEKEMRNIREQKTQFKRYVLHQLPMGGFVYRYQPTRNDHTPAHDICTNCMSNGKKSILQKETRCFAAFGDETISSEYLVCPMCKHEILFSRT